MLRSWRMLPGQSCDCSTAMASAADPARREAHAGGDLLHEILDEFGDVLAPLGERGHADRHDRQAVEEVLAELAFGDRLGEVAARRRDDAHVDVDALRAADALEILVDQHAQDLGLRLARHVGDFVEIERAAMRLFERADAPRPSPASTPNSSASMFSGDIVGALTTTNGPSARAECAWMSRAASSLPEPARAGNQDARIRRADAARSVRCRLATAARSRPCGWRRRRAP